LSLVLFFFLLFHLPVVVMAGLRYLGS